jgi:hypothetical protein
METAKFAAVRCVLTCVSVQSEREEGSACHPPHHPASQGERVAEEEVAKAGLIVEPSAVFGQVVPIATNFTRHHLAHGILQQAWSVSESCPHHTPTELRMSPLPKPHPQRVQQTQVVDRA